MTEDGKNYSSNLSHCDKLQAGRGWRLLAEGGGLLATPGVTSQGYCGFAGRPEHD
jgi:hypothetical protein